MNKRELNKITMQLLYVKEINYYVLVFNINNYHASVFIIYFPHFYALHLVRKLIHIAKTLGFSCLNSISVAKRACAVASIFLPHIRSLLVSPLLAHRLSDHHQIPLSVIVLCHRCTEWLAWNMNIIGTERNWI